MATYYIGPTGDDANDGSYATPYKNLVSAVNNSRSADTDTIVIKEGTTIQDVVADGLRLGNRVIVGETGKPADCVLDFDGLALYRLAAEQQCIIEGFTMQNIVQTLLNRALFGRIQADQCDPLRINNMIFNNIVVSQSGSVATGTAGFIAGANTTFSNNILRNIRLGSAGASGHIFGSEDRDFTTNIRNVSFYYDGSPISGTQNFDRVFTIRASGSNAVYNVENTIMSFGQSGTIQNAFAYINEANGGTATFNISNCCLHNVDYDDAVNPSTNTITADPLLVDPDNGNFNLRPTSPCIGTGTLL